MIAWTEKEKDLFVKRYIEVEKQGLTIKDKLAYCQKDIDRNRKKVLTSFLQIWWFEDHLNRFKTKGKEMTTENLSLQSVSEFLLKETKTLEERLENVEKKELAIKEKFLSITQRENELRAKENFVKEQEARISREKQEYIKAIKDAVNESILNEETLVNILSSVIEKQFQMNVFKQAQEDFEVDTERKDLKKILVFSLGSAALSSLRNEFKDIYNISIWKDRNNISNSLKANYDNYYRIYGSTDTMSHNLDGYLKDNFDDKYIRYTGGASSLKKLLEALYLSDKD